MFLAIIATCVIASLSWTIISIIQNYIVARRIGLPIVISPVSTLNPFWILLWRGFPRILSLKHLPFGLGTWARCTSMGWAFEDKYRLHEELGPLFTLVTPAANEVTVAEPEVAHAVLARRKDFIKPAVMYEQLNVFGRNLNTVEGEDWQRHRRLTAPSFNEKTSSLVWAEARRQAQDMVASWFAQGATGTTETVADTATLALHVLTCAGFGASYSFNEGVRKVAPGHEMTYRDSLSLCLRNIITFAIIPKRYLSSPFMPRKLRQLGQAVREFQEYMDEMLARERRSLSNPSQQQQQQTKTPNLMSALVRASDEDARSKDLGRDSKSGLTDEEIFGNIFAYNLAGHETTANTVAYALVLLAAHPEYQDWVREEIKEAQSSCDEQDYEAMFPRLQRCLAVMYETLRLYGSIVFIPRAANQEPQTLPLRAPEGKSITIPPSTAVNINVQALHTDPKTWGADSLSWRPDRWFVPPSPSPASNIPTTTTNPRPRPHPPSSSSSTTQTFISPPPGTYIPWADGPRVCPGQKFAQVEFVAVMAALLSHHRVSPAVSVPIPSGTRGESDGERGGKEGMEGREGREALKRMVDYSAITAITLQMREPGRVAVRWDALP